MAVNGDVLALITALGGGGGGGTDNYNSLSNKPQINNITLSGNKTSSDLSLNVTVEKQATAESGYTSTYVVKQGGTAVGNKINTIECTANNGIEITNGFVIQHTNSVFEQGTQKLDKVAFDGQGHITGVTEITTNRGIDITSNAIGHTNSITSVSTQTLAKVSYDTEGHITGSTAIATDRGLDITNNNIGHTNSIVSGDDDITFGTNTITLKKLTYDAQGHISNNATGKTIAFRNGIKSDTDGHVEHSNSITAQTTQNVQTITYDSEGHITAGEARPVVTTWSTTTLDTNIPSEKLTKDELDTKIPQYATMPTASVDWVDKAVLYIGNTTTTAPIYTTLHLYKCVVSSGVYSWADLGTAIDTVETSVDSANNLTINLKSNGTIVSTSTVAIVTTSIIETAYFDATTNELVLEFSNGQSLRFNLTALLAGLLPMAIGFTMTAAGWTSDGAGGYIYDLTAAINTILANIPVYNVAEQVFTAVTPVGSENPSALHWCELLAGGGYELSSDTTVDTSKTYYASTQVPATLQWYEKAIDGSYSLSVDTYVNPAKTYFIKTAKTLTGTYQFNASADKTVQSVLDASSATQIALVTTKVAGTWKLYAMAKDGKPNAQITLPVVMTVVNPTVNDMSIVGQAIYKSVASVPSDTMTLTNKTINADDNTITDLEGDNFKASAIGSGLEVASKVLKHSNSVAAVSSQALAKVSYDTEGHITGSTALGVNRGLDITSNNLGHTNSVTAGDDDAILGTNSVTLKKLSYDVQGHVTANANGKTLTFKNGIKSDTSGNVEHSNSVEADETLTLKSFTYDAQGHITGSGNKNLGRGISDEAGFIGHSNTAVAAQTTQNVQAIKYDAYGHITAGAARPIVTAWSSTTADTNIPSEKLVKTALDTKIDTAGTGLSKSGTTLNHSNSITAGTAGTSSATSGTNTLAVPYVTYDAQGHVTAAGTHTHTIGNASASALGVMKVGTGLSASSGTVNHSNSVTAQTTATLCKIKFDAQGHITGVTAVTPETWTIVYENGTTATKQVVVL